jgi:hypothetical protein
LGVKEDAILEELKNIKVENNYPDQTLSKAGSENLPTEIKKFTSEGRKKLLEDRIISLLFKNPHSLNLISQADYCLFSGKTKSFLEDLNKVSAPVFASEETGAEEKLKTIFADISQTEQYRDFLGMLSLLAEAESENDGPEEVELCLSQLKDIELRNELGRLSGVIKNEAGGRDECLKEFDKKAKELHFK